MGEKEALLPQRSALIVTVAVTYGHFLCGVGRVIRFVNVRLHCAVSNLKRISKMSTFPHLENFMGKTMNAVLNWS